MDLLKEKIRRDGKILPGSIIKVDSFLNHQLDVSLFNEIGKEFKRRFSAKEINKIITLEASGIALAVIVAQYFDNCPVVFAKKTAAKTMDSEVYSAQVVSYTRNTTSTIQISKNYLNQGDHVLIVDDFLATGEALQGLIDIVHQACATVVGCGIVIEKGFQDGGKKIRSQGIELESLAIITSINEDSITFEGE